MENQKHPNSHQQKQSADLTSGEDVVVWKNEGNFSFQNQLYLGLFQKMVPLAELMQKMLEIENALPMIRRLDKIIEKNEEKMDTIGYKLSKFLDSNELYTRLDIFERDLFLRLQQQLDKLENRMALVIETKANKQETKEDIKIKANYTDFQRAMERIIWIDMQINSLISSQDIGAQNIKENVANLMEIIENTKAQFQGFASLEKLKDIDDKLEKLEEFYSQNLASTRKFPAERSIDNERQEYQNKKHQNQNGYGDEYFELLKRRYDGKPYNEFPLKERINYIQVQVNEMCETLGNHSGQISKLFAQQQGLIDDSGKQSNILEEYSDKVKNMIAHIQDIKKENKKMEDYYSVTQVQSKNLSDYAKKLDETIKSQAQDQQILAVKLKQDHDEFSKRLTKLEVNTDTQHREIELIKSTRKQVQDKIESEILKLRDIKTKLDRQSRENDTRIMELEMKVQKIKENLEKEINLLKEPIHTEISKLRQENIRLFTEFENQKNDYRELTGGFLKVISTHNGPTSSNMNDSPKNDFKMRDQFLNKQFQKTFYSETQRVCSPFSGVGIDQNADENKIIVPLPDIPRIFTKAQAFHLSSNRSCSTAMTNKLSQLQRQQSALDHYKSIQQKQFVKNDSITSPRNNNSSQEQDTSNFTMIKSMSQQQLPPTIQNANSQQLKKFKHLMEQSQQIVEEDNYQATMNLKIDEEDQYTARSSASNGGISLRKQKITLKNLIEKKGHEGTRVLQIRNNGGSLTSRQRPKTELGMKI